jgi:hypothetical protein
MMKAKQALILSCLTAISLIPDVVSFTVLQFHANVRSDSSRMSSASCSFSKADLKRFQYPFIEKGLALPRWKSPRIKQTFVLSIISTALNRFHNFDIQQASDRFLVLEHFSKLLKR